MEEEEVEEEEEEEEKEELVTDLSGEPSPLIVRVRAITADLFGLETRFICVVATESGVR